MVTILQELINEIGNKYGALTVLELTKDKNGRTAWLCKCDCGGEKIVRGSDLRKGKITSCGCRRGSREKRIKDLTGQRFGKLTVLCRDDNNYDSLNKKNRWLCKCDCGNIKSITGTSLICGSSHSCGCFKKEQASKTRLIDLTGMKFGKLTVIERDLERTIPPAYYWKCQCACGNTVSVITSSLKSGNTKSCGCLSKIKSYATIEIENFLKSNQIKYQKEYTFPDLLSENKARLRFDFAIWNNKNKLILIEYNGQQHYRATDFFGGKEGFIKLQKHDKLKEEYCKKHKIPFYVFSYKEKIPNILEQIQDIIKK